MQLSLSLYLASFFFNVFLCESGEVLCLVWLLFLSFFCLTNKCLHHTCWTFSDLKAASNNPLSKLRLY